MPRDNLTREEAEARAALVSDLRYEISLDLSAPGSADDFPVETTITFACSQAGASTFLDHFAPSVESLEVNGEVRPPSDFDGARIALDGLAATNTVRVRSRSAYSHSGVGMHRAVDPTDDLTYLFTDFEPFDAHKVFPCFDQPDLKGVFSFTVLAPEGWEVASNVAPSGQPEAAGGEGGAATRHRFHDTPRMSAYITAVIAGPYHVVRDRTDDGIDLGIYCRRSLARYLDPDEIFEVTKQGFAFFQEAFDYPYPWGKYDQAFVPEFNSGAMENIGCVTFNEAYVFRSKVTEAARERRAETILHEMAHMWFGDLVTMRWWDDLWLNESFATFMALLSQVKATRFSSGWVTFANSEKTWAYQQDQLPTTHPIVADMPETEAVHVNFDGITYAKGASVLRQLVAWVGEEEFFRGIRRYFKRHEYGNTTLSDFLAALEEASGRDLQAWSKDWLETAGVNTLRASFATDDEDTITDLRIVQEAPAEWPVLRPHRLTVGLYDRTDEGMVLRADDELDVEGAGTDVPLLVGERRPDLVLVNDRDLAYAKIRLDERSLANVVDHLREMRDPLPRAIVWSACWDMVRDAEMSTRDYVSLALSNVAMEEDIGVVQRLLGQALSATEIYGEPANRSNGLARLAEAASRTMRQAEPGSDNQLAWARAYASAGRSDADLASLKGLLDGAEQVDGLAVDTELRWHLVQCLAAAGAVGEDVVDAELERDPTDAGRRHASAARASRPTAEAKEEAWQRIVGDTSLSTSTVSAIVRGFQQPGERALLEPYAERYFDMLKPFWDERDLEVALVFTRGMYPWTVIEPATLETTDRYLEEGWIPWPVRRLLLEGRDGVRRAMAAQERDAVG
jgi:aminopeptidase N